MLRAKNCVCLFVALVCMGVGSSAMSQTYFEWLIDRPEILSYTDLQSQSEVINNVFFSDKSKASTTYDSQFDAAKFIVKSGNASIEIGDQVRHEFPFVNSGNLLVYWESLAPSYWARNGGVDGVNTYKAFQLSDRGDLALEFRYRFSQVDAPYVARTDVRVYGNQSGVEIGPGDSAAPQTGEFNILPNKWTRFWAFIDFDNNRFSYWVGDQDREAVKIIDSIRFDWSQNYGGDQGFSEFWFEFNTSQDRPSGPNALMYGRNLAILRDVSDQNSIVAGFSVKRPAPPEWN